MIYNILGVQNGIEVYLLIVEGTVWAQETEVLLLVEETEAFLLVDEAGVFLLTEVQAQEDPQVVPFRQVKVYWENEGKHPLIDKENFTEQT